MVGAALLGLTACTSAGEGQAGQTVTVTVTQTPSVGTSLPTTTSSTPMPSTPSASVTSGASALQALVERINKGSLYPPARTSFVAAEADVYCSLSGSVIGCELTNGGRIKPPPGMCPGGGGARDIGRIVFGDANPEPQCNSDTIVSPNAVPLKTGQVAKSSNGTVACLAEANGVSCFDRLSQTGFFLGRGSYAIYTS